MIFSYNRLPSLNPTVLSFSSSGDNIVIAAIAAKRFLIHRLFLVVGGSTNLTFKRGSTNLSGALPMTTGGGITLDISGEPWFTTGLAEDFIINSSGAVQVSGAIYYDIYPH